MQVDSQILEKSWGWSWGAHGEPAWRQTLRLHATTWLGTWQYLKVGRLGSQTRSLCRLALVLGRERLAVLNVAPDVGVEDVIARAWGVGGRVSPWPIKVSGPCRRMDRGHHEKNPDFQSQGG